MKRLSNLILPLIVLDLALSMSTVSLLTRYCSPATSFRSLLVLSFNRCRISSQCRRMKTLTDWSFCQPNLLMETFPLDPVKENYVRRVPKCVFSHVTPDPLKTELTIISASDDALENILDLEPGVKSDPKFAQFVAGNILLPGSQPLAHRYGGYQFGRLIIVFSSVKFYFIAIFILKGYWADQLGDGRAILLGDYVNR